MQGVEALLVGLRCALRSYGKIFYVILYVIFLDAISVILFVSLFCENGLMNSSVVKVNVLPPATPTITRLPSPAPVSFLAVSKNF